MLLKHSSLHQLAATTSKKHSSINVRWLSDAKKAFSDEAQTFIDAAQTLNVAAQTLIDAAKTSIAAAQTLIAGCFWRVHECFCGIDECLSPRGDGKKAAVGARVSAREAAKGWELSSRNDWLPRNVDRHAFSTQMPLAKYDKVGCRLTLLE